MKKGVMRLFIIVVTILILGISSGCNTRRPKMTPEERAQARQSIWERMEKVYGKRIALIAAKNDVSSEVVIGIIKGEHDYLFDSENTTFLPTIKESEAKIEKFASNYGISKKKVADIIWDWDIARAEE